MDRKKLPGIILSLLLTIWSFAAQAETYQWKDDSGRVHFSDRPPANNDITAVTLEMAPTEDFKAIDLQWVTAEFELDRRSAESINTLIPEIFYLYRTLFGLDLRRTVEVKLNLFDEKPAFDAWVSARTKEKVPANVLGIFLTKTREVAVWRHSEDVNEIVSTVLHESSHVIMAQLSPYAPSWIQEGMAEYFETMTLENNMLVVQPPATHLSRLQTWRETGKLINLRNYLGLPEQQWRGMVHDASPIPYTVAWGTLYFMLDSENGKRVLRQIMQNMEKSQAWPNAEAIDNAYPGGLTRMDYEFFKWLQQDEIPEHRYVMHALPDISD